MSPLDVAVGVASSRLIACYFVQLGSTDVFYSNIEFYTESPETTSSDRMVLLQLQYEKGETGA